MTAVDSKFTDEYLLRMLADVITHGMPLNDLDILLRAGVRVNGAVRNGLRPLHFAVFQNNKQAVSHLCNNGALVNLCDEIGYTPLHLACKHGHLEIAEELVNQGAIVNFIEGEEAQLAHAGSRALAQLTVQPLNLALENNYPHIAEFLLKSGANAQQSHFLGYEINLVPMENLECLKVLLKYGADINSFSRGGLTPLMKASKEGWIKTVKLFLEHGADVNLQCPPGIDRRTALHFAAGYSNGEVCRLLLEAGASTVKPPDFESTPLEFAINNGKKGPCRTLLRYGGNPNELNDDKCSPLQLASSMLPSLNQSEIIELLLSYGADPTYSIDVYSYRLPCLAPIVEYVRYQDKFEAAVVHKLLKYGSEVNLNQARERIRILDKYGILEYVHRLEGCNEVFEMLINVAGNFNLKDIEKEHSLPQSMKTILLREASKPRRLKHQIRLYIRRLLMIPVPEQIELLPLPRLIKDFLLYDVWDEL